MGGEGVGVWVARSSKRRKFFKHGLTKKYSGMVEQRSLQVWSNKEVFNFGLTISQASVV